MRATQHRRQSGFSLMELMIVVVVILIIAGIAVGALMKARMRANEASAVASLRSINTACTSYNAEYGTGFPASLTNLAPAAVPSAAAADLIEAVLVAGTKSGYNFVYTPAAPVGGIIETYTLTADPITRGASGQRSFYTDQVMLIRANATGPASASDPPA